MWHSYGQEEEDERKKNLSLIYGISLRRRDQRKLILKSMLYEPGPVRASVAFAIVLIGAFLAKTL